jgi:hypothetical protein
MKTDKRNWWDLVRFFLEWEILQVKFAHKIKTRVLCSITSFRKSCCLWIYVKKYGGDTLATDYNTERCMRIGCCLSKCYRHILRICNIYCFSTATMVMQTRLKVTLVYIACLIWIIQLVRFRINLKKLTAIFIQFSGYFLNPWNKRRHFTRAVPTQDN